jgi:hypothetical protein
MIREVRGDLRGTGGSPVGMVENLSCGAVRRCGNGIYLARGERNGGNSTKKSGKSTAERTGHFSLRRLTRLDWAVCHPTCPRVG